MRAAGFAKNCGSLGIVAAYALHQPNRKAYEAQIRTLPDLANFSELLAQISSN
jgi:hypothetical protein